MLWKVICIPLTYKKNPGPSKCFSSSFFLTVSHFTNKNDAHTLVSDSSMQRFVAFQFRVFLNLIYEKATLSKHLALSKKEWGGNKRCICSSTVSSVSKQACSFKEAHCLQLCWKINWTWGLHSRIRTFIYMGLAFTPYASHPVLIKTFHVFIQEA